MQTRINLLPQEYRKKTGTPWRVLLPAMGTLTMVLSCGAFWAWTHFGQLAQAQAELDDLNGVYDSKKPLMDYSVNLKSEVSDYQARATTIEGIAASRVLWTRKIDELTDVVNADDGGRRFMVWLKTMEVKPSKKPTGRKATPVGESVKLEGLCFSDEDALQRFNTFHEDLKDSDFYRSDFVHINNPAGQAVAMDDELKPSRAWTVKLGLTMKAREKTKGRGRRPVRTN